MNEKEIKQIIKKSIYYNEWDGKSRPSIHLIQLVYDFKYSYCEAIKPDKETQNEIISYLFTIKEQ